MTQRVSQQDRTTAQSAFARRQAPGIALVDDAERVARACYDMAVNFHGGGRLFVFGNGGAATDALHISVEFVHPVIVGKRALPSLALTTDVATITGIGNLEGFGEVFAHQLRHQANANDIALGVSTDGRCEDVLRGLEVAKEMGLLTIGLVGGDGGPIGASPSVDHVLEVRSDDPQIVKEVQVTTYHILWELVHVFFEQPGVLDPGLVAT